MEATSRLLLELYRGARELPVPEFQEQSLELLKSALRFDSAMLGVGEVRPDSGLIIQCVHLHNQPQEMLASYEEIKDRDLAAFEAAQRVGRVCNFNCRDMNSGAALADLMAHSNRYDIQNLLVTTVHDKVLSSVGFLSLWRAKERDRYSEVERLLGEHLMPHLLEAATLNRLLWLNQMTESLITKRGTRAIGDNKGELQTCDPEFVALLRKEWPDWTPPILPSPFMESLRRSPEYRFVGNRISASATAVGEMLFLRAQEKSAVESLTPAELTVSSLVADGLSYKHIAKVLGLSPATVRNELHSVYVKLGVNNKVALAQCIREMRG